MATKTKVKVDISSKLLKPSLKVKVKKTPNVKGPKQYKSLSSKKRTALLNILSNSKKII